jgi:3-phosphoshikimate 1-carboxyvinyltransferase
MAMAFAPAALFHGNIRIADAMVVTKSYPSFYEDLKVVGFAIETVTP